MEQLLYFGFRICCQAKGVETIVLDPEGNLEKAVAAMEDLIAKSRRRFSIHHNPELDVTLYEMAKEAESPLLLRSSLPADTSLDYISCVACQYEDIGYAAGKFISETIRVANYFM